LRHQLEIHALCLIIEGNCLLPGQGILPAISGACEEGVPGRQGQRWSLWRYDERLPGQ
jgi:hypothetical protein